MPIKKWISLTCDRWQCEATQFAHPDLFFFQEPLAVRDVSANGTGLQHSGVDEIFW